MTHARTERIRTFLDQVAPRLTDDRYDDVNTYLREEEWQLAVEMIADSFEEQEMTFTPSEWSVFESLSRSVELDPDSYGYLRPPTS